VHRVFGLPAGPLSMALVALLIASGAVILGMGLRNPVFVKIGLRNIPRRRSRSALIVLGLMLGTAIIASALLTGDTMAATVRSSVVTSLGLTDETVTAGTTADVGNNVGEVAVKPYFSADPAVAAVDRAAASLPIDGVAAAIIEPVAGQHTARGKTEPRMTLFAPDAERAARFGFDAVERLAEDDVVLNRDAARELAARPGDSIVVLAGEHLATVRVASIDDVDGTGTDGPAVITSLANAQRLLAHPGDANYVLVSNRGGSTAGAALTGRVERTLDRALEPLGLDAQPAKQDGLDAADATGNTFVQLFTTFGSFSMAAGVLLIFLIFVLLSGERRAEMGMARAVGTQRGHLVQSFLYEGAAYDVVAAAIGAVLGIGVSAVMVRIVARAFESEELELKWSLSARSLVIAYGMGVLLTLVVVTVSAWRVSRLNIVSAIRNLPEPAGSSERRTRWALVVLGVTFGLLLAVTGASGKQYVPWMLGLSFLIISAIPIARLVGLSDRIAFTIGGGLLLVLWILPLDTFDALFGDMAMDFTVWIAGGLLIVVAATWVITYNADVLLQFVSWLASPFPSLRPVMKMAVAYPLRNRFRTGVTMAMFMLVVFTLVTGTTIPSAFVRSFDDVDRFGGGFDVRVTTAPAAATPDLRTDLPANVRADVVADAAQSFVAIEARQSDASRPFERYAVRGVDQTFLDRTRYRFAATATGYESGESVWSAMAEDPHLAVVDSFVAPRRTQWGFAVLPDFQLSGFYLDDGTFDPVPVTVRDPLSGQTMQFTVVGVLSDDVPFEMAGITVGQGALTPLGDRALPTVHHLAVAPGADTEAVANRVEAALLARGAEAKTYAELLDDAVGSNMLFIRLVQGFMALGLVVGVAALGVISARAVVERRQQLGMLRAIGFQPEMIRRTLLGEASIVSLSAIGAGCIFGLLVSYNVITDSAQQPGWSNVSFGVPWLNLLIVFVAVYVAALLTTVVSSIRATRIYPAEALRYR
jgi:putative ABC transport system permease protein